MVRSGRLMWFYLILQTVFLGMQTTDGRGEGSNATKRGAELSAPDADEVAALGRRLVVVTGASGHVGISIIEELLKDADIKVRAVYWHHKNRLDELRTRLHATGDFDDQRLETQAVDVLDQVTLAETFTGAAAIVHLAAVICIHSCSHELAHMRRVNLEGTRNVLAAAQQAGVRSFIHYSSTHAYRHFSDRPLAASNGMVEEGDSYDASKAAAQQAVVAHAQTNSDFRYVILAPSGVIGRNDHPDTDMWPLFERHKLVRFGPVPDGSYASVDVRQLSRLTYLSLQQLLDPSRREKIHAQEFLVTGRHVSICEFIKTLQEVTGEGHCLNLGCRNKPFVVPLSWLSAIAPYCESVAGMFGKKSLITSYSMGVLGSLPSGVDPLEFDKMYEFFGDAAIPYSLKDTFRDRFEAQDYQQESAHRDGEQVVQYEYGCGHE